MKVFRMWGPCASIQNHWCGMKKACHYITLTCSMSFLTLPNIPFTLLSVSVTLPVLCLLSGWPLYPTLFHIFSLALFNHKCLLCSTFPSLWALSFIMVPWCCLPTERAMGYVTEQEIQVGKGLREGDVVSHNPSWAARQLCITLSVLKA